jgi:signal transduction histidine kinase
LFLSGMYRARIICPMWIPEILRQPSPRLVLLATVALVGMIGWLDHFTQPEWSFFAPFAIPIALATWQLGPRAGFPVAALCAVAYWLADMGNNTFNTNWGFALSVFGRWLYFSVLVVAVAALKARREHDGARIESLERMHELERAILEVADREKERLGRELHDGVCQTLAGIAALSTTLSRKLAAHAETTGSANAAALADLLHEAIAEVRDVAHGLGPLGLQKAGLDGALDSLAVNLHQRLHVACTFQCARPFARLPREVELHLFRIAQEAVNNAVAHGRAERIEIGLSCSDGQAVLSVQDDGVGLPPEPTRRRGIGLETMALRADLLGGSLEVRQRAPHGTTLRCTFPLPATPLTREQSPHAPEQH